LHGLDVQFREGEITFVMGRNGAGKTTLLRALAGLIPIDRGEVMPDPIETRRTHFRDLAYVAQDPGAVLGQPTAAREIDDVLAGTGRQASTGDALARWGLSALAVKDPRDISGGERQRLALAAMLVGNPKLILLDEPTRGMDAESKATLIAVLRERRDAGACVIVACHDVELAARCADRVVLLSEGDIIADGPPADVLTGSITFSTQANKLFGGNVLTVEDAVAVARGVGA
jgi:energy-coupling factor transport system ATP-binding protein